MDTLNRMIAGQRYTDQIWVSLILRLHSPEWLDHNWRFPGTLHGNRAPNQEKQKCAVAGMHAPAYRWCWRVELGWEDPGIKRARKIPGRIRDTGCQPPSTPAWSLRVAGRFRSDQKEKGPEPWNLSLCKLWMDRTIVSRLRKKIRPTTESKSWTFSSWSAKCMPATLRKQRQSYCMLVDQGPESHHFSFICHLLGRNSSVWGWLPFGITQFFVVYVLYDAWWSPWPPSTRTG